ncbi:hypothetical protein H9L14_11755 [Sphingomonas sediminicola]|uniref:Glycosyl hydrolase family 30 beta sandwich domain-containing protein n=1 Tax=Sphingomonas sediminicola TaxID=386874 RepID=A0ABX6T794_9SPHN|nr:hypothetical protein H9L14_11755 [Sphingomonas sediminicola]
MATRAGSSFPGLSRLDGQPQRWVEGAAFLNRDGSRVAILYRKSGEGPVSLALDGERYSVAMPAGSVATLRWGARSGRQ